MVTAVGLMMWQLRLAALDDVHQNLSKLGMAISEQTSRSMQAVDLELQSLQKNILEREIQTPERFTTDLRSQALFEVLRQAGHALPQANAFTVINANGKLVNYSRQWPIPPTDLSDRDYFKYFRDHNDGQPLFTNPVQNRGDGNWTLYIVRRINGASGNFLGLVLGAIDLDYFRDFYKALTVGAGTTVTLLKSDGTALVSYPQSAPIAQMLPADTPWHSIVARKRPEAFETEGVLAPGLRVVSVHPLLDYPLVVNVSVSEWASLASWRKATLLACVGTGSAVLCMILLMRALGLQLRRLERSEGSLARNSAALSTTLGHMNQGIMMVDADGTVAVCNVQAMRMLDLPAELAVSHPSFSSLIDRQRTAREFDTYDEKTVASWTTLPEVASSYERHRPNGRILQVETVPLDTGGMVRTYTDITDRRKSEEQVRYFAHHDDLTKLVNRVVFRQRLEHAIELADRSTRSVAVFYLDLDRFKLVNDTKGHAIGDLLLVEVAVRLTGAVRDIDTVARMGGDEFAIIQPLVEQLSSSTRLAERVAHALQQPFYIDGSRCNIGVSVGIALYPDSAQNSGDLLRSADIALYRAKADGRGTYCVFDETTDSRQQRMFALEQELQQALDLRQFDITYQPVVNATNGRVESFEALLRWNHPQRGTIAPIDFVQLAEETGLIIPIGLWVIEAACEAAATWPDAVGIAVNLSPLQFNQEHFFREVTEILYRTGVQPDRLIFELTERLLLRETDTVLEAMSQLRASGVRLSLDDFGTAHAGLGYLQRFSFDIVKIDKSFIRDIVDEPGARAIVAAVLGIGSALGLDVIAEGVETAAQLSELRLMKCPSVQGYLTGRPGTAAEARTLIRETSLLSDKLFCASPKLTSRTKVSGNDPSLKEGGTL